MVRNTPYKSFLLNCELQKLFKANGAKVEDSSHALKNITLVGVLLPDTADVQKGIVKSDDLWPQDRNMIINVANSFAEAGIPFHPEAEFTLYNLLPPIRSDFLMSAPPHRPSMDSDLPKSDIVLISYIPKYGTRPLDTGYNVSQGYKKLSTNEIFRTSNPKLYTSVSIRHNKPNIWAEASFKLGAKFIAVRGCTSDEVTTQHLKDHEESSVLIESTSSENIGYIANKNTIKDYASHVEENNALGQAIKHALN